MGIRTIPRGAALYLLSKSMKKTTMHQEKKDKDSYSVAIGVRPLTISLSTRAKVWQVNPA